MTLTCFACFANAEMQFCREFWTADNHSARAAEGDRLSGFVQNSARCSFDRFRQLNRGQNRRATTPTQNPTLDFREAGQFQTQLDAAVLQFGQLLRRVPAFFPDVISHQFVKTNEHVKFASSGEDAKTVAQPLFQRESVRADKDLAGRFDLQNSRRNKGADVVAQMTVGKKKPFAVNVGQMIWVNAARRGLFEARLAIRQF